MELATPITVYWDLPDRCIDSDALRQTCAEIIACRPLMVQLSAPLFPLEPALGEALALLSGSFMALFLTVPASTFPVRMAAYGEYGLRLKELLLSCDSLEELQDLAGGLKDASNQQAKVATLGISFPVTRGNWRDLPGVLACCRDAGISRLVLPMQRLYHGESPFFISRSEQDELSAALDHAGGAGDIALTIHDPFLWRAFYPGRPFPQAGCQAANTMIAIAPDGAVYPCPALPFRLGSINEMPLKDILASPGKRSLRAKLLEPPAGCGDCRERTVCRGGCRGRGLVLHGTLDGIDGACR
jgi:GeoRSP system SPASM domain protein